MMDLGFDNYPAPRRARVEIIPLIDVIFFLLATFVLFTLSLQKMRDLEVPLPMTPPDPHVDFTTLNLQATANGMYYWKIGAYGTPELLGGTELPARLESYRESTSDPRVFIRSDGTARFGDGIYALDQVRLAGIKQVSVETITSKTGN